MVANLTTALDLLVWVFLLVFASRQVVKVALESDMPLIARIRASVQTSGEWYDKLASCPKCFAVWVAGILVLLIVVPPWVWIVGLAVSRLCTDLDEYINRKKADDGAESSETGEEDAPTGETGAEE